MYYGGDKKPKLRWFGHLVKREDEEPMKRVWRKPVQERWRGDRG